MMKYQITRFGEGFEHRSKLGLRMALIRLRRKLRRIHPPYTIDDGEGPGPKRSRPDTIEALRKRFQNNPNKPRRFVVRGSAYDQPPWVIRSIEVADPVHPLIRWGSQYVGRSSYRLGADGPPGPSDCSGFTRNAVKAVYGIDLPHSAALQRQDSRFEIFYNADRLQEGDFIWTNYARLRWPTPDHVEIATRDQHKTLGSRPSTGGVNWFNFTSYDRSRVVAYGRLKRS